MPDRELLVRIVGDDRDLQKALVTSERATQRFGRNVDQQIGKTAQLNQGLRGALSGIGSRSALLFGSGAFLGTAGITAALRTTISAASDLNEQISKSRQVFGTSSAAVEEWSRTTAQRIGIARAAALEATGTFGNLFSTVGLDPAKAAEMSQRLTELAADLASFNNATPEDTLEAIRSGLIGEAEPLRRYGVLLSEARVQQQAMSDTGKSTAASLTDQEKALARYELILRDTAPAQGDFARTSGGLANQQRILRANTADLAAEFGETLVPALTLATQGTNDLLGGTLELIGGLRRLRDRIQGTDFFEGFNKGVEDGTTGLSRFFVQIRDGIPFVNDLRDAIQGLGTPTFADIGKRPEGTTSPGTIAASNAARDVEAQTAAQKAAQRRLEQARKRFAEFTAGLGLKLKKAGISPDLGDDIRVLEEIQRAIQREIRIEGRTFALESQLTDVEAQIANARRDQTRQAEQEAADAKSRRQARRRAAQERARDREEAAKEAAEAARTARERRQFLALGLTGEGEQRIPSAGALRRRAGRLQDQIRGTVLDTSKTRAELERIANVLSGQFGKVGRKVRESVLSMLNDISEALTGGGGGGKRPHTAFRVVNTTEILNGLGLSEEEIQKLRRRLSRLGPGGTTPRPGGAGGAFGFEVPTTGGVGNVIFSGPITVVSNDPDDMARKLQKKARRTTVGRTGASAGRPL